MMELILLKNVALPASNVDIIIENVIVSFFRSQATL